MAKLTWSPRSLNDLEIIFKYIKPDSEENARNFIKQLITATVDIMDSLAKSMMFFYYKADSSMLWLTPYSRCGAMPLGLPEGF